MTDSRREDLRLVGELSAAQLHEALLNHSKVMSDASVRYAAVADADNRIIDALKSYRAAIERETGLSVLLGLPSTDDLPNSDIEQLPNDNPEDHRSVFGAVVLQARWHFRVTDPKLVVAEARRKVGEILGPDREEVSTEYFDVALAALFDHDGTWPTSEY